MKTKGCKSVEKEERDIALLRNFRIACSAVREIHLERELKTAVNLPCRRFYVSHTRAALVISKMDKGIDPGLTRATKVEMFEEIFKKYKVLKKQHPDWSLNKLMLKAVTSPAPKMYLEVSSAKQYLSRILRKCRGVI